jgi:drug/metabolite transporter (DMT)-like permease
MGAADPAAPAIGRFQPLDWVLFVVPGLIWGSSFFFIAVALESLSPGLITPLRVLLGFATLSVLPASRAPVPRGAWPKIALLGVLWLAVPLTLFPYAEQHVSSSVTGMLNGGTPVFALLVASAIHRRLPSRGQLTGILVGLVGVVLIALPTIGEGSSSASGVAMIVVAVVMYGFAINVAAPLQRSHGALPVLRRAQMVALVLLVPLGVASLDESGFAWRPALAVLVLGVLGTAVAHAVAATLAGRVGATRASATTYLMPVVSLTLGTVVRGEHVAALAIVGSGLALAGAAILGRSAARH